MPKVGILPLSAWPDLHITRWEAGIRPPLLPGDPFGGGAKWRAQTIKTTAACWGRCCYFLQEMSWLDPVCDPWLLVPPEVLRVYIAHLAAHNRPATVLHRIVGLERALAVLSPLSDRSLLRQVIAHLEQDYEPVSKRERLQEVAALVELGFSLMRLALEHPRMAPRKRAVLYRDGLAIALLAMRPLRLSNFASIELGVHLVREGVGWRLLFAGEEMKNHKPIDPIFPADLVDPLESYLSVYRPILMNGLYHGGRLWVSWQATEESEITIRQQIKARTERAFGLPITPHLFRECAATSLAVWSPEEVQIAHLVLGNSYAIMQKHYNLARTVEAANAYNQARMVRLASKGG